MEKPDFGRLAVALQHHESCSVLIWTTTPWTLPANQAVCLHPDIDYAFVRVQSEVYVVAEKLLESVAKDCNWSEYKVLGSEKGQKIFDCNWRCARPLSNGTSPLLLGDFVTLEQGTGCVHIAPGHGQEDYLLVLDHNASVSDDEKLAILAPLDDAGRFTEAVEGFSGQHVLKANPALIEELQRRGVLVGEGTISHSYPHCWRCKSPVIFRATEQWFVSMEKNSLRTQALQAIDAIAATEGWIPPWGRDRIHGMVSNRPDWCLSRQRAWGTPIPGFTCLSCKTVLADPGVIEHVASLVADSGTNLWFEKSAADLLPTGTQCPSCQGTEFEKEKDILDVWFESGVSHAAVLKFYEQERGETWWPADLYLEGSDQHRGWFHSALLAAVTTDGKAPYRSVLTHGFVVDGAGKKMSKSAGNVVAPQDVIKQSGAEILRLWVAAQDYREDLRISREILQHLVEAYRKIRNTCRFLLSNLYDFDPSVHRVPFEQLSELDRWALLRLGELIPKVRKAYGEFEFHAVFHALNNFCAVDMSAVYLDILKDRLYTFHKEDPLRRGSQTVLLEVVTSLTRLMAPVLTFTAEEIWAILPQSMRNNSEAFSVHLTLFPSEQEHWRNPDLDQRWKNLLRVRETVLGKIEAQRRDKILGSSLEAKVIITATSDLYTLLSDYQSELSTLFICSQVELQKGATLLPPDDHEVLVKKADGQKCERCWKYRDSVGNSNEHPTLCALCIEALP